MKKIFCIVAAIITLAPAMGLCQWTPYTMANSPLPTDFLISLRVSPDGKLLIGSQSRGLSVKDSTSWQIYNQSNTGVPINYPHCLKYGGDTLFVGTSAGNLDSRPFGEGLSILHISDSSWSQFNSGLDINNIITGIEITPSYRAIATYGGGITIFTSTGWIRYQADFRTEFTYADSQQQTIKVPTGTYLPTDYLKGINYDSASGTLWIATLSGGAVSFTNGVWHTFDMSNSGLPSNRIQLVKANHSTGKIYFGTYGFGLVQYDGTNWTIYNTQNSPLSGDFIYSLEIRPDNGDLWIGTNYGLSVLNPQGLWHSYVPGDSNLVWGDFYSDIAFDSSGNVWVATFGGGMASKSLHEEPPPPPQDTLIVDVIKAKFFLRHHHHDVTWLNLNIQPDVDLVASDTVSISVTSRLGRVYSWSRQFSAFRHLCHWHHTDLYLAFVDGSSVLLSYRHDLDRIRLYLLDWQTPVNRDSIAQPLTVNVKLGDYVGHGITIVGPSSPTADSDADTLSYNSDDVLLSNAFGSVITGIDDNDAPELIPDEIQLPNVYPNPFNASARISFTLTRASMVTITVYDILGRVNYSRKLDYDAGEHSLIWDGTNKPSGVYYYTVETDKTKFNGKMTLLK